MSIAACDDTSNWGGSAADHSGPRRSHSTDRHHRRYACLVRGSENPVELAPVAHGRTVPQGASRTGDYPVVPDHFLCRRRGVAASRSVKRRNPSVTSARWVRSQPGESTRPQTGKLAWIGQDLEQRLSARVGRLRFVANLPAAGASNQSCISISGKYVVRENRNNTFVVEVMPRVRIGSCPDVGEHPRAPCNLSVESCTRLRNWPLSPVKRRKARRQRIMGKPRYSIRLTMSGFSNAYTSVWSRNCTGRSNST